MRTVSDLFDFSFHYISFLFIFLILLLFLLPYTFYFLNVVDNKPAHFRWGAWKDVGQDELDICIVLCFGCRNVLTLVRYALRDVRVSTTRLTLARRQWVHQYPRNIWKRWRWSGAMDHTLQRWMRQFELQRLERGCESCEIWWSRVVLSRDVGKRNSMSPCDEEPSSIFLLWDTILQILMVGRSSMSCNETVTWVRD